VRTDITVAGDPQTLLYEDVAPGGLTNHWSCAVPRFSPDDFHDAERAGVEYRWPVGYDDLVPWYGWVEPLLRISGAGTGTPQVPAGKVEVPTSLGSTWQPIVDAARAEGQAVLPVPYVYGAETTMTLSGTVFNSFVRLLKPLLSSPRVRIRHGVSVTSLEWSGAKNRVDAVLVRDAASGATERIPCRAVIVAAGAINTAKILLQSTSSDFPAGLGNTHGVLGRYLHDHPLGKTELEVAWPIGFHPAAMLTRQPLERTTPLYAAACLQWSGVHYLVRSLLAGHPGRVTTCGFNVFGTMAPSKENYIALDPTKNSPDGTPGVSLKIEYPPEAARTLVAARDQLVHLLDAAGLQPQTRMWDVNPVGSAVHYAGSCRMHASPEFGMLNGWSRLHAVRNVVVADSAAFTTGPEKNPALTAMALSARASSRLAEDIRTGVI
jgi:choline dehydrogenase-like flavoprotein